MISPDFTDGMHWKSVYVTIKIDKNTVNSKLDCAHLIMLK